MAQRVRPGPGAPGWDDADAAVEQLYAGHWRQLVRLSVLLVRDQGTAEEVVQDAFVELHRRWGRLEDPDKALAYLRQTVVNRSRSVLRHRKVVNRHLDQERARPETLHTAAADESVAHADRRDAVLDALRRLPRRQREVLVLRYYLDLSEGEIATTLGVSRGSIKSHASRGAAALRALLPDSLLEGR
ncbi:SigE family RNA polymerase sigma factor [Nocardioides sp.]|uniref:SigE family RNA polymerase sigma factor n=1 Tax=Nocardioides sp. TaxID=35761 RepID=UPI00273399E2|nr:SigE family RNA polymerase sigma factor [Nocardioides sp.]MDP3891101.1 SigE family RNA polymerase sigma factor [Nocardioides sp.]